MTTDTVQPVCSLLQRLRADLKTAMKAKNACLRDTVRQVMAEFPRLTVPIVLESGKKTTRPKRDEEITDEDICDVIRGLVKSEKILLEAKKQASSDYLGYLEAYLPRMADQAEIAAWIAANIDFSSLKTPNQAMGPVMKHFGKRADGNLVRRLLAEKGQGR